MLADRLVLYPSRDPVDADEARREWLADRGLELWVHRRPASRSSSPRKLFIVHFIGNASRAEWEHPIFLDALPDEYEIEAWVLNYPGYGKSAGDARLNAIPSAARAAHEAVARVAGGHPLLVSGNSLGTASAIYLASLPELDVRGLIVQNPPPLQDMILKRFGWWNLWVLAGVVARGVPRLMNSLINAPQCRAPALFLTSERDVTVPPAYQRKVFDAYAGPKMQVIIPNAGHDTDLPRPLHAEVARAILRMIEPSA